MLASLRRVLPVIAVAGRGALVTPQAPDPQHTRVVHESAAACSSLVTLPGLAIGLLFERAERSAYEPITFTRFPLDRLTAGADRPRARVATRPGAGG